MYLEEIVQEVQLESDRFECKSTLNREDIVGWMKTISGFANAYGGEFYIGVEDKTNKLIGFDRASADRERNYFNNQVNEHLTPRPQMNISFVRYEVNGQERFLIRVTVAESTVKPVILKYKGIPAIFMRRDGFTNGATYEEIIEMSVKSKNAQYDLLTSEVPYDPSEFNGLRAFYKEHNGGKELTDKALRSMGFYDENGLLANGAVLFSDHYDGGKTGVQCSVFSGNHKGSERIVTVNRFEGNILSTVQYMLDFVHQRMNHSVIKLDDSRLNISAYPERALFEGVVNAVAHRDYYLDGTQIQLDMFRNRLEISSPGGFYRGDKIGKTYDLTGIISKRRNELIASVLVACNVMEAAGTGFDKIAEEYEAADEAHKPWIFSASDHFTLVLPDLTCTDGTDDPRFPELLYAPVSAGSVHDGRVLSYCYYQARKASDIATFVNLADSGYFRKNILENLTSQGYLLKSKTGRTVYYRTNPEMCSPL